MCAHEEIDLSTNPHEEVCEARAAANEELCSLPSVAEGRDADESLPPVYAVPVMSARRIDSTRDDPSGAIETP